MQLGIAECIVVFTIVWWLCLFMVLPFGVTSQYEAGNVEPGTEPGAPVAPRLWTKLAVTTLLAGFLFACFYVAIAGGWLSLDTFPGFDPTTPAS